MSGSGVAGVEKTVTDLVGVLTASIGLLGLCQALLGIKFFQTSLPLLTGTFLGLLTIGFGVVLTTHGATRALILLRKTFNDFRS